jgi:hypothetical protein
MDNNRMNKMLDAIWPNNELESKDPPTSDVQKFFDLFKASKEPLREYTRIIIRAFVT